MEMVRATTTLEEQLRLALLLLEGAQLHQLLHLAKPYVQSHCHCGSFLQCCCAEAHAANLASTYEVPFLIWQLRCCLRFRHSPSSFSYL